MKKLIIAAISVAMTVSGYSVSCRDVEDVAVCRAWDVKMKLKTLAPEKIKCGSNSVCGDSSTVYCLDDVNRTIKGYLWICDYTCDDEPVFNCVLWDEKNHCAVIAYNSANIQTVSASDVYAYGKKATKVAGTIDFSGTDAVGDDAIAVTASGLKGKFVRGSASDDGYIKALSGQACGLIKYVKASTVIRGTSGTLCEDATLDETYSELAKLIPFCEACCFDGWCDAEDAPDMIPAVGTWSMKYNKKVSTGSKSIRDLIPSYAI